MSRGRPPAGRQHRDDDHRAGRPVSQRQLRVGELLRHLIAELLRRDTIHDPHLSGVAITISEVRVSPDLKNATVFALPLSGRNTAEVIAALNHAAAFIRGQVSKGTELKFTPKLTFIGDESFDEADRIRELLETPRVKHDLEEAGWADDED
ncbi:30S ribosome-binding factor RbfA [Zavarzinia compransoris]|uniref:30S ribosome-binding factor RbfA n=1 Tax=Zavarzinia marina TaxID=2911065 RepID=UPI001F39F0CA|nr:30S ribosome-binding factor RbfA [Zavarzinia marina]MCF4165447.1 30S ribosome-binding factor RbfA [Zavarzinia marina]